LIYLKQTAPTAISEPYEFIQGEIEMRLRLIAALLYGIVVVPAAAAEPLTAEQKAVAMWANAAQIAADKCPKVRLIKKNIKADLDAVGLTAAQASGGEWKNVIVLVDKQNRKAYADDPAGFCELMWKALGSGHSVAVKLPLLTR
jgi:hypothetical protein